MTKTRRKFSSQEKVRILRQHLVEKTPVSDVCDQRARMTNEEWGMRDAFGHLPAGRQVRHSGAAAQG